MGFRSVPSPVEQGEQTVFADIAADIAVGAGARKVPIRSSQPGDAYMEPADYHSALHRLLHRQETDFVHDHPSKS